MPGFGGSTGPSLRSILPKLMYLKSCSPAGGAMWRGYITFRKYSLWKKYITRRGLGGFRASATSCLLSLLPAPATCSMPSSAFRTLALWSRKLRASSFCDLLWSQSLLTVMKKQLTQQGWDPGMEAQAVSGGAALASVTALGSRVYSGGYKNP